jgi:Ca2+-binding EF-hand superfamily protein
MEVDAAPEPAPALAPAPAEAPDAKKVEITKEVPVEEAVVATETTTTTTTTTTTSVVIGADGKEAAAVTTEETTTAATEAKSAEAVTTEEERPVSDAKPAEEVDTKMEVLTAEEVNVLAPDIQEAPAPAPAEEVPGNVEMMSGADRNDALALQALTMHPATTPSGETIDAEGHIHKPMVVHGHHVLGPDVILGEDGQVLSAVDLNDPDKQEEIKSAYMINNCIRCYLAYKMVNMIKITKKIQTERAGANALVLRPASVRDIAYAGKVIGVNVMAEPEYMWLAEDWLGAELDPTYVECRVVHEGSTHTYYHNTKTNKSQWHHPKDAQFRRAYMTTLERNMEKGEQHDGEMDIEPIPEDKPHWPPPKEVLDPQENTSIEKAPDFDDVLYLQIHKAHNLGEADANGLSDPYVIVFWDNGSGEKEVGETAVKKDDCNPIWTKEIFELTFLKKENFFEGSTVRLEVYDHDDFGRGDFLGEYIWSYEDFMPENIKNRETNYELQKKPRHGRQRLVQGQVQVSMKTGERIIPREEVHVYPFKHLKVRMTPLQRMAEYVDRRGFEIICMELGIDVRKECAYFPCVAEFLDRVVKSLDKGWIEIKPLVAENDEEEADEKAKPKAAQAKLKPGEKKEKPPPKPAMASKHVFDGADVRRRRGSKIEHKPIEVDIFGPPEPISGQYQWFHTETLEITTQFPLVRELKQKVARLRAYNRLTTAAGPWADRWWIFGVFELNTAVKTQYVNFHSLETRETAPPILSMATYQTQRIIRGFLGRKRFQRKRDIIRADELAKEREKVLFMRAGMTAEARLRDEAKEAEANLVKEEKASERAKYLELQADRQRERLAIIKFDREEKWQKAYGDNNWGKRCEGTLLFKRKERDTRDEHLRLVAEAKAKEHKAREDAERERQRKIQELAEKMEREELRMMAAESAAQTSSDRFWGLDKELTDQEKELMEMAVEDARSSAHLRWVEQEAQEAKWHEKHEEETTKAKFARVRDEKKLRNQYMKVFWKAESSDAVMKYRWPALDLLPEETSHATGYTMDAVYNGKRISAPISVFHAVNPLMTGGKRARPRLVAVEQAEYGLATETYTSEGTRFCGPPPNGKNKVPKEFGMPSGPDEAADPTENWAFNASNALPPVGGKLRRKERKGKGKGKGKAVIIDGYEVVLEESATGPGMGDATDGAGVVKKSKWANAQGGKIFSYRMKEGIRTHQEAEAAAEAATAAAGAEAPQVNREELTPEEATMLDTDGLAKIFSLIDCDDSGMIEKEEMMDSIETDLEVKRLVKENHILRPLLKKNTFEEHFMKMDTDNEDGVSWEEFLEFCMGEIVALRQSGVEVPDPDHQYNKGPKAKRQSIEERREEANREQRHRKEQTPILQEVFRLIDSDNSGVIDQDELLLALEKNHRVQKLAQSSDCLRPLLEIKEFEKLWSQMDTDDEDGVSLDEFVEFCLMMSEVCDLNGINH